MLISFDVNVYIERDEMTNEAVLHHIAALFTQHLLTCKVNIAYQDRCLRGFYLI